MSALASDSLTETLVSLAYERGLTYIDVATAFRVLGGFTDAFWHCIDHFDPDAFYKAVVL